MEQAVNSFLKGLLLDTYPVLLGKESLSDALNATLVTLTGNELVLQNDMGNRRVDNAFLPSGYEPIGIKEHGGIIYVAAYNPITGRGLVGSFPSPLKKENISDDTAGIDFNDFIEKGENNWIKRETLLIPLTGKNVLHAGDKFSIYYGDIVNLKNYLTNYDLDLNTPNRLFTLSVGILNSQNEFVDITKDLIRWNNQPGVENVPPTNGEGNSNNKPKVIDTSSMSEEKKFNTGYFIAIQNNVPENSENKDFIQFRLSLALNNYNYKLVSPLYLKAQINHILDYTYTVYGEKTEISETNENDITEEFITLNIEFDFDIYYNCPIDGFEFNINFAKLNTSKKFEPELNISKKSVSSEYIGFDSSIGLYHEKLIQIYEAKKLLKSEYKNKTIKYEIKTPLIHGYYHSDNNPETFKTIYVPSLTKNGTFNIRFFASDTMVFKGFRYYNDLENRNTIFKINVESYPKKESKLLGIFIKIYNTSDNILQREEVNTIESGEITYKLKWNESINERHLYKIRFGYIKDSDDYNFSYEELDSDYNFLTTELFNGNFMQSNNSSNSTFDSSNPYNYDLHGYEYIPDFRKIKTVKVIPEVSWKYKLDSSNNNIITDNSISTSTPDLLNVSPYYKISHLSNNTIKLYNIISVKDSELYPSNVKFKNLYIKDYNLDSFTIGNTTYTNTGTVTINDDLYTTVGNVGLGDDNIITVDCKIPTDVAESQEHNITDEENQNENPLTLTVDPVIITIDPNNHTSNDDDKVIIEKNPDGFIPEDIETGYVLSGEGKEIIFNYVVNNIIKSNSWTVNKESFTINNVITSFYKFVKDNSLYNVQAPYFDLNFNHAALQWIIKSGNDPGSIVIDDSEIGDYLTGEYNVSYMSVINNAGEAFNKSHENHIFIMDCDNADKIYKVNNSYNIYKDTNNPTIQGFRRIWIRYSENKFIPFLIYDGPDNNNWIPSGISLLDPDKNDILKQCKNMKQYYAFKSGSLSKELYTLPEDKYVKSKEFDYTSYITIEYSDNGLSLNNASNFFIAGLINEEKYVIPHNFNIKSNDDFLEYVNDYIFNRNINCAIIDDDDKIYVGEGNLDPLYMYEKKSNTEFIKRQIPPTKISLGNNLYLPCLSLNNNTINIGTLWDLRLQSHLTIFSFNNIPLIFGNNF